MATPGVSMMRPIARRFAHDGRRVGTTRAQHVAHRQRRRQLIPIGIDAQGPTAASTAEVVVLHKDMLNTVVSSTGVEVKIVRDADNGLRFYIESLPASAITIDDSAWVGQLAGSGVVTLQDLADWLDQNN